MSDMPKGMQVVLIPASDNEDHLVPTIVEEYKLYFNLHLISLMFTQSIFQCDTWDVHEAHSPYMHNINQSVWKDIKVPITKLINPNMFEGSLHWTCPWWKCIPEGIHGNYLQRWATAGYMEEDNISSQI